MPPMSDRTYKVVNALGRAALRALDVRVHVHGMEHLPASGPVVLAANHVSYLDFVVLERAAVERGRATTIWEQEAGPEVG